MSIGAMEERLERILARVIDWLKFAEAKNAALVTVDVGAVAGVIGWLASEPGPPLWIATWLKSGLALLVLSAITALASFLPVLSIDWLRLRRRHGHGESVVYFGHIAGAQPASYLAALRVAAGAAVDSEPPTPLERDYAAQIVVNAGIAAAKFRLFTAAMWLAGAAVLLVAVGASIEVLR